MTLSEAMQYLGGKTVAQDVAGEFVDLALLSQRVSAGVLTIQQDSGEIVVGCQDGVPSAVAEVTPAGVTPLQVESWTDIPLSAEAKVGLIEVPLPLVHLLLGMSLEQETTSIASKVPLALAVQFVRDKAEVGIFRLGVEQGTLLLQINQDEHRVIWVGESGVLIGQEALDFVLSTFANATALVEKISLESEEEKREKAHMVLDAARKAWSEEQDINKALELIQQVVPTLPIEARILLSQIYRAQGNYDKAMQELVLLIERDLASAEVYGRLAKLYEEQDRVVEAIKTLRSALGKARINDLQILRYLVSLHAKRQMVTELIEVLDEIISRCEDTEEDWARETIHWAMHRKGLAFMLKGDVRQSVVFLEKAIEIDPKDIGPYQDLSKAYREIGNLQEAILVLQRGLEFVADSEARIKALNTIGNIYMSLQQHQNAANTYREILEIDPANLGAFLQLGLIYDRLGNVEQARHYFQKAVEISPENPVAQNYLVKLQGKVKRGKYPAAGPTEDVRLRGEPQVDDLFALLHIRVKRELTPQPSQLSEIEATADGWLGYAECIKKGTSLKHRTDCFQEAAKLARVANDPQLFALAAAQYCSACGYFEFRFRGDHQAARYVYYRPFIRLVKQMTPIPKSMVVSYQSAINAYLFSCLNIRVSVPLTTDRIIEDILADEQAKEALKEEIAFLVEEHPALLMEVANRLKEWNTEFVELCVDVIQQLISGKPYEAFSALLRLDRDITYFGSVVDQAAPAQTVYLARALIDFSDPSATTKTVRKSLPKIIEVLSRIEWDQKTRQELAFEVICYRRDDPLRELERLRTVLLRIVLRLEKKPGEEVFQRKVFEIGGILARFKSARAPQDKFLYGKQIESELDKAAWYMKKMSESQREVGRGLLNKIRKTVQEGIAEISMYPDIGLDLITIRLPYSKEVCLHFSVRNVGFGPAEDVGMRVVDSERFLVSQVPPPISVLSAESEAPWELSIRPLVPAGELTLEVTVHWSNIQKREGSKTFEFVVTFYPEEEFQKIPQRYIYGKPIEDPSMFYGRNDIIDEIVENLKGYYQDNVLVLQGQRRVGKTSLLYKLEHHDLKGPYVPVFIDMQELSGSSTARLCSVLVNSVLRQLRAKRISVPISGPLPSDHFREDPLGKLGEFFDQIEGLQDIRILLLIDEFESLMRSIQEGTITGHFYNFLRGLMQHKRNVSFIFAGADELQEMMRDYASIMFNIARFIPIGYLSPDEAEYLIRKPVEGFLTYDDTAVEAIKAATAGNPYYIQLICYNVVERMNREKRNVATIVDVNEVIKELLRFGSSYFEHLWRRSEPIENIVLACLAELADPRSDRWVGYSEIIDQMHQLEKRYDTKLTLTEEGILLRVTKTLRDRGVIEERRHEEEIEFRIHMDLFREWFKTYQPLGRTVKEVLVNA